MSYHQRVILPTVQYFTPLSLAYTVLGFRLTSDLKRRLIEHTLTYLEHYVTGQEPVGTDTFFEHETTLCTNLLSTDSLWNRLVPAFYSEIKVAIGQLMSLFTTMGMLPTDKGRYYLSQLSDNDMATFIYISE